MKYTYCTLNNIHIILSCITPYIYIIINYPQNINKMSDKQRCHLCGQTGHFMATCFLTKCYTCGETGHISSRCPNPTKDLHCIKCKRQGHDSDHCTLVSPNNGKVRCYHCGKFGHFADDCFQPKAEGCYNCGDKGHTVKNCPLPYKEKCYNCGEAGHISRTCPKPYQEKCFKCGIRGHIAKECYKYTKVIDNENNNVNTNSNSDSKVSSSNNDDMKIQSDYNYCYICGIWGHNVQECPNAKALQNSSNICDSGNDINNSVFPVYYFYYPNEQYFKNTNINEKQ